MSATRAQPGAIGGARQIATLGPRRMLNPVFWLLVTFAAIEAGIWIWGLLIAATSGDSGNIDIARYRIFGEFALIPNAALGLRDASVFQEWLAICKVDADLCQQMHDFWLARAPVHAAKPHQFLSHMFLHGGPLHLLMNSFAFLYVAPPILRRMGRMRFMGFFLLCGFGGAAGYILIRHSIDLGLTPFDANPWFTGEIPLVGASGAIFGIWLANYRITFERLRRQPAGVGFTTAPKYFGQAALLVFGLNIAFILLDTGIAGEAHIGGAVTGFLLAPLLFQPPRTYRCSLHRMVQGPLRRKRAFRG